MLCLAILIYCAVGLFWTMIPQKSGVILDTRKKALLGPIFCGYDIYVDNSATRGQEVVPKHFPILKFHDSRGVILDMT